MFDVLKVMHTQRMTKLFVYVFTNILYVLISSFAAQPAYGTGEVFVFIDNLLRLSGNICTPIWAVVKITDSKRKSVFA